MIEDFESGDFTSFEWHMSSDVEWIITDNEPFNGVYSSRSGNIDDGEHILLWSFEKDGSVSSGSDCGWIDDIIFPASTTVISVNEYMSIVDFKIFPNPGIGHYTLTVSPDYEVIDVIVYNPMGKVVAKPVADFINGQTNVDLSSLKSGIYFIEINSGAKKMINKVIQR